VIVLWGLAADGPLDAVRSALERAKAKYIFLDQHLILDASIELSVDDGISGTLELGLQQVTLENVSAVYVRPYDVRLLPAMQRAGEGSEAWRRGALFEDTLTCWLELTDGLVVNKPSSMASNNSKPYQCELLRRAGFKVPETLVTTDAEAAQQFIECHDGVIYKSLSGIRSIVSRVGEAQLARLADVANCPTQFQEYVAGTDIRVHVIGNETFVCEIDSDAVDYRYAHREGKTVAVRAATVPSELAERCVALSASLGLTVSGFDLRRTPAGEYVCFEVNPSPGFTFYEEATGQPIADAIARLMQTRAVVSTR
jgi:glutathione synthase/RimK-type ligase-like ATP-grasp enzyme